ncbi:GTP-binding protein HflX [invertebrate metagenome]|uniref:GTP-binding protein HflX n=1 Tax=invertebrate metagenome TaxID=1711999 RepID=A0A484H5R7_9ZZZZ
MRLSTTPSNCRTLVVYPAWKTSAKTVGRLPQARLAEAVGLARAIALDVVAVETVSVRCVRSATYLGEGAAVQLGGVVAIECIQLAFIDCQLSPVQQRNLERLWQTKVIDRTALILEIFGARAHTREGALQVELAHLSYQRSRLVRSWTHLERQRGGFGFLGGPGETQIEVDRRILGDRIARLQCELDAVKRTRALHRRARRRVPYPVIALVGYTNAGKSTIFNLLTKARVKEADQLFATLDPTMRTLHLPSGRTVIVSDTVGFISDLPHELVAAFCATLEEVTSADIIVHVRDISHPDSESQRKDVEAVLHMLGLDRAVDMVQLCNKIDLLAQEAREKLMNTASRNALLPLSSVTGEGLASLLAALDQRLARTLSVEEIAVPLADGATLSWLYRCGEVLACNADENHTHVRVRLSASNLARLYARLGKKREQPGLAG